MRRISFKTIQIVLLSICFGIFICTLKTYNNEDMNKYSDMKDIKETLKEVNKERYVSKNYNSVISNKTILIFVAYMRSGSSFASMTFQEYEQSFFLFEPIRTIVELFRDCPENSSVKLSYVTGNDRFYQKSERKTVLLDELKYMMTCGLDKLSLNTLTDNFHRIYTKHMSNIELCIKRKIQRAYFPNSTIRESFAYLGEEFKTKCLEGVEKRCRKCKLLVMKFIRLSMRVVKELFPLFPNLKVVHLSRDARGIFYSRMNLRHYSHEVTPIEIRRHCKTWADDLKIAKELSDLYPDRVMILKYEVLARSPEKMFRAICDFTGIPYTYTVQRRVNLNSAATYDGCAFCQERKNSSETAENWRKSIHFDTARYLYGQCEDGNKILNYLPFENENDMRNLSIPFYTKATSFRNKNVY